MQGDGTYIKERDGNKWMRRGQNIGRCGVGIENQNGEANVCK